jgi:hypothetical protein
MNLQLNLITSMYVHQGAPPTSYYNLWYIISEYVTLRRLGTDVNFTGTLLLARMVLSKCFRHIWLTSL